MVKDIMSLHERLYNMYKPKNKVTIEQVKDWLGVEKCNEDVLLQLTNIINKPLGFITHSIKEDILSNCDKLGTSKSMNKQAFDKYILENNSKITLSVYTSLVALAYASET